MYCRFFPRGAYFFFLRNFLQLSFFVFIFCLHPMFFPPSAKMLWDNYLHGTRKRGHIYNTRGLVMTSLNVAKNSAGLVPWGTIFGKSTYSYLRDDGQSSGCLRPRTIIIILLQPQTCSNNMEHWERAFSLLCLLFLLFLFPLRFFLLIHPV